MSFPPLSKSLGRHLRALRQQAGSAAPASVLFSSPVEPLVELLHSRWAQAAATQNVPPLHNLVLSELAPASVLRAARGAVHMGLLPAACVWSAPRALMHRLAGTASPPAPDTVVAQAAWPREDATLLRAPAGGCSHAAALTPHRRVLVLDAVQDPANVASAVRSAAFWGWHGVVLMPGTCQLWRDKVLAGSRLSALALPHLRVQPGEEQTAVSAMSQPGCRLVVAMPPAPGAVSDPVGRMQPGAAPCCAHTTYLAIGNEGHGVGADIQRGATHKMSLGPGDAAPQQVQSMNAAAAAAVCMAQLGAPPAQIQPIG